MSINGKRDNFTRADILSVAKQFGIRGVKEILSQVLDAVARWSEFAKVAGVPDDLVQQIALTHRLLR
jgi:serine/threonine-protein kinase HipA